MKIRLSPTSRLALSLIVFMLSMLSACSNIATQPASTPVVTTPTPTPTVTPANKILTFFVAGGDNGKSGKPIGCNDSIVPVQWEIPAGDDPMQAALEKLFSFKDQQLVGPVGLYNALYQSDLVVSSIAIDDQGLATVKLTGTYLLGGVCDNPRFKAQIEETVAQFTQVKSVQVYINDQALDDILSGK